MREFLLHSIPYIVLGVMALAIYYFSSRVSWAFGMKRWIIMLIVGLITVGAFVTMMIIMRSNNVSAMSHVLSNASNIIIGVLMFAVCITLLVDLVALFLKIPPLSFGLIVIGLTAVVSWYSLWNADNTRIYNVSITLPSLTQPMRIAHVSDTHFGHFWDETKAQQIADMIKGQSVDVVLITGDMFDGRVRLNENVVRPFAQLGVPVFFSEGNHDSYSGTREIKNLLRANGIMVLENEKVDFKGLQIVGLDYLTADSASADTFHGSQSKATIESILPTLDINPDKATILLHHNPVGAKYAEQNGVNLYLAGHTHAGQLFPATLVSALMFEYNKGLYKYNENMQIYVSQGTGTFGPPMRLGTHSELTIIDLN